MRRTHSPLALAITALLAFAACKKESKADPATTAADHHAAAIERVDRLAETDENAATAMRTLAGRLEFELEHRPTGTIKAEAVFAALTKAGVPITDGPRQFVGVVVGAAYCVGGQTADGLGVSVCEYDSPEKAAAGKASVEKRFADLNPVRDILVRGATTLTLTARPDSPLASSKRTATEAFDTL